MREYNYWSDSISQIQSHSGNIADCKILREKTRLLSMRCFAPAIFILTYNKYFITKNKIITYEIRSKK